MAFTEYTGDTTIIGALGTNPAERGLTTQEFKDKFDQFANEFVAWFNATHLAEAAEKEVVDAHLADTATLADMGHVKHGTLTATLTTTWDGSEAPYTQEVTVNGIIATDNPIIDIVPTGTYETDSAMENAWANVYRIITAAGKITAYAHAVPEVEIPLQLKVVR